MVYNWLQKLQSVCFQPDCRLCKAPVKNDIGLCQACKLDLPWLFQACHYCAIPLPGNSRVAVCADCQKQAPPLDRCSALFAWTAPISGWVQALKFQQQLEIARLLGCLLAEQYSDQPMNPEHTIIPVPIHRKRLSERGYNQALEIARPLQALGYSVRTDICTRKQPTSAQSRLSAHHRQQNIRGAFSVDKPIKKQKFILIDDVMTTGATLFELARLLKQAGAAHVEAWVIARTPRPEQT